MEEEDQEVVIGSVRINSNINKNINSNNNEYCGYYEYEKVAHEGRVQYNEYGVERCRTRM